MYLIVGASGRVGSRVASRLLDRGEPVRAVTRDPARISALAARGAVPIRGDLRDGAWMDSALGGVRGLVLATHGLVPPTYRNNPLRADLAGNRTIIDAAKRAGVGHVVFVSVAKASAETPVLFNRLKHDVEQHLAAHGPPFTIVRPTVFIETHALLLMGEPLRDRGTVTFLGSGRTPLNWISADDVADYVVRALDAPGPSNAVATIGGPDQLGRVEVLERLERALGRTARRKHVPRPVLRAARRVLGPVHPGIRFLLDIVLAEEMLPEWAVTTTAELDWVGPTTVDAAVRRWAGTVARTDAAPTSEGPKP